MSPSQQGQPLTADWIIERYVRLRDKKREIEARHKEELTKYNDLLTGLENWLLHALDQAGLDSMKSQHGTAYRSTRTSATVTDWPATLEFIKANEAWELLEARVSKLAAQALIAETQAPIPGVKTSSEVTVNVRKAQEK